MIILPTDAITSFKFEQYRFYINHNFYSWCYIIDINSEYIVMYSFLLCHIYIIRIKNKFGKYMYYSILLSEF